MDQEQVEMVGKLFVDRYYHLFDNDRASVSSFYQPSSMLNFEGQKILGVDNISCKLSQLPFDKCRHDISTIDSQPSSTSAGSIVVFVSGSLQLVGEEHSLRFNQMFHLVPIAQANFFVQNDIFRLNYG
ncbi:nuclear transport factor 2B [Humulus lupulus]|uniref:nuclear transport factor 2B n=1 Tax=Humulus lupulus TaxID=3486 RepID=UPI002B414696|nr:nuclear transport factor 2B [Humulus lupulus]